MTPTQKKTTTTSAAVVLLLSLFIVFERIDAFSSTSLSTRTATTKSILPPLSLAHQQHVRSRSKVESRLTESAIKSTTIGNRHTSCLKAASSSPDNESFKQQRRQRPKWAASWMPTSLITLRPVFQLVILIFFYIFHLCILQQHNIPFPIQIIPNEHGRFQSIGCDSLAGILSLVGLVYLHQSTKNNDTPVVPSLWSSPRRSEAPWRFPRKKKKKSAKTTEKKTNSSLGPKETSAVTLVLLIGAYFNVGRTNDFFADFLDYLAMGGVPISTPMFRSLTVLLGHLAWVAAGSLILSTTLRPRPFFGGGWTKKKKKNKTAATAETSTSDEEQSSYHKKRPAKFKWYTNKWDTYWLWWTLGGYYVSSWLFNVADFLNQIVLPISVFEAAGEGVVSQLINPENNDFIASLVGYIAPCLTAPWWEEVLYRGFLFPALNQYMAFWPAVFVSGILFSIHHLSTTGAIPLAMLGFAWAVVYAKSGNLMTTILIHAMWNSRVFLGSWLGL